MSPEPTLDLHAAGGISALDFSALTRVISAVYPDARIGNITGGYRITLSGDPDLPGLPQALRDLADEFEDD